MRKAAIVWFRNDLRLHDNVALHVASQRLGGIDVIVPVFCFDPRQHVEPHSHQQVETSKASTMAISSPRTYVGDFPKCGRFRMRFLIESVADLRNALRSRLKSDLVVAHGRPEHVIAAIVRQLHAQQFHVDSVVYQKEISAEEVAVEQAVERACTRVQPSLRMRAEWGSTLYHRDDLPFGASGGKGDIGQLPAVFSQFRKAVETQCSVREALSAPKSMAPMPGGPFLDTLFQVATTADGNAASSFTAVPLDDWLRAVQCTPDPRGIALPGGETHALARLNHYLFESNAIATYKDTRNGLIGMDYSSKFSAYLAHGCLSPREIYHAIQRYTAAPSQSPPTDGPYWMTFEIIWRDFFKFVAIQHGHRLFMRSGFCRVVDRPWSQNAIQFEQWRTGKTGVPWVDAGMRELAATGCLSNRMRQNVASFLTHSLGIDWRLGAAWFESVLVDHDVEVNYGNWQYVAGVGNDPRENRKFNMIKQARDYDPEGNYIKLWCPELGDLPAGALALFMPWKAPGIAYPSPMILEPEWERQRPAGSRRPRNGGNGGKNKPHARGSDWKVKRFDKSGSGHHD